MKNEKKLPERRTGRHSSRVFLSSAPGGASTEIFSPRPAGRYISKPNRGLWIERWRRRRENDIFEMRAPGYYPVDKLQWRSNKSKRFEANLFGNSIPAHLGLPGRTWRRPECDHKPSYHVGSSHRWARHRLQFSHFSSTFECEVCKSCEDFERLWRFRKVWRVWWVWKG